jgi:hypothetical protein
VMLPKEDAMKSLITRTAAVATLIAARGPAAYASDVSTHKVFISGPLILLFLGFCALVVVAQVVPVISTLYGMLRGVKSSNVKATAKASSN